MSRASGKDGIEDVDKAQRRIDIVNMLFQRTPGLVEKRLPLALGEQAAWRCVWQAHVDEKQLRKYPEQPVLPDPAARQNSC